MPRPATSRRSTARCPSVTTEFSELVLQRVAESTARRRPRRCRSLPTAGRSRRRRARAGRARSPATAPRSALAQHGEAQVADDERAHRRRMAGVAQAALHAGEQRFRNARQRTFALASSVASRRSSGRRRTRSTTSALPEPTIAAIAPASAGPTARATLNATAPSATARDRSARRDDVVDRSPAARAGRT